MNTKSHMVLVLISGLIMSLVYLMVVCSIVNASVTVLEYGHPEECKPGETLVFDKIRSEMFCVIIIPN